MNEFQTFDYTGVTDALIGVSDSIGFTMIEEDSEGDSPAYPFANFNIISPDIPLGNKKDINVLFEAVVSITFHSRSKLGVLNCSKKLSTVFKTSKVRESLREKGIVVVSVEASRPRDNFISIAYERMAGFDLRLRLVDAFQDQPDVIEKINFELETGGN